MTGPKKKILIIEDDPSLVSLLRGLLSERYVPTFVSDGKTALDNLRTSEDEPGAIILDHRLPDMTGLEVIRELKRIKPQIPVIFMTGYGSEDLAVKAFKCGAKDYLKKPFNYRQLSDAVEFCLSLSDQSDHKPRNVLNKEPAPASDFVDGVSRSITHYNLQKALVFINNNYMNKISLATVAKRACTSKHHFSRQFKKYVGCTYREYLKKVRTEKARDLLKGSKLSVTEAAISVGYANLRNFERIFKKIHGCTPHQYRNGHAQQSEAACGRAG